ncbi:MAG TPA: HlyD family efflux transporter periplasmic adaptor subunit [Rugosimonospora sp.]
MRLGLGAVRLPRTRLARWITAGVAVVAAAAIVTVAMAGGKSASPTAAASTVSTVRRGTVSVTASAAGTVQAAATRGLSFTVGGTVSEVDVRPGQSVTAGQVLARIDNSDAQTAVNSAQDAVDSAQNALTTAEQTPTPAPANGTCVAPAAYHVTPAGEPTSGSPSPTTSASPSPSSRPSATPTARPTATGTHATTAPGHGSSGGGGAGNSGGSCGGSGSGSGGSGGSGGRGGSTDGVFSAQQQLNNAQLALLQAQDKLAGTVITAPVAGKVLSVAGTVGGSETPGSTAFISLGGVNDTEVTAQFTESDVAHLAVGQPASITLPDRAGQKYTGKVSEVSPAGTMSGRLVRYAVLIAFDQVPADLLYGQSANVAVTTQSVDNVLYVSSSAVTGIANNTATVTVRSNGHDEQRNVHIGLRGDQYTEIQSGLSQGDSVVVGGR